MKSLSSFTGRYLRPCWKRGSSFIFRARTCLCVNSFDSAGHVSGELFLIPKPIDKAVFKPYGQILSWEEDGKPYDAQDLSLQICDGTPRLYIFRSRNRGLRFSEITYHEKVSQCLLSMSNECWYLAVAKPTFSLEQFPTAEDIEVFQIEGDTIVKMEPGVWHAGPMFLDANYMDFLSLELSDTNIEDHNTHVYTRDGIAFSVQLEER